jgi:hypothetical protein
LWYTLKPAVKSTIRKTRPLHHPTLIVLATFHKKFKSPIKEKDGKEAP